MCIGVNSQMVELWQLSDSKLRDGLILTLSFQRRYNLNLTEGFMCCLNYSLFSVHSFLKISKVKKKKKSP